MALGAKSWRTCLFMSVKLELYFVGSRKITWFDLCCTIKSSGQWRGHIHSTSVNWARPCVTCPDMTSDLGKPAEVLKEEKSSAKTSCFEEANFKSCVRSPSAPSALGCGERGAPQRGGIRELGLEWVVWFKSQSWVVRQTSEWAVLGGMVNCPLWPQCREYEGHFVGTKGRLWTRFLKYGATRGCVRWFLAVYDG